MPVADYATGIACGTAIGVPLALAAVRWRRRILPGWSGPPAHLATIVIGSAGLFAILQVLGTFGAFRRWPVVATCAGVGVFAAIAAGPTRGGASGSFHTTQRAWWGRAGVLLSIGMGLYVVAFWSLGTFVALNAGPVDSDTQTYHLPHAARFVQEASLTRLHFVTADNAIPYHPANGEALHALGILAMGNDAASPLVNHVWAILVLVAAWSIGHRWGHGAASACAVAVLLVTPVMVTTQPGSAMTDTMGLFFFLAAIAFFVSRSSEGLVLGGLAGGLALSTKLTFVAPIGLLTIAVLALGAHRGQRVSRVALKWLVPMFLTGSFWFLRNTIQVGNPVPSLRIGVGPLALPKVPIDLVDRFGYSVAHYAFDFGVWRRSFVPGLRAGFGVVGPFAVLAIAILLVAILLRRNDLTLRLLAGLGLLSAVAYAFTPTTALGLPGRPTLFTPNLRYLTPALAVGLILGPGLLERWKQKMWLGSAFPILALAVSEVPEWPPETRAHTWKAVGVFLGLAAITSIVMIARNANRQAIVAGLAAMAIVLLAVGFFQVRRYAARRYSPVGTYAANGGWDTEPFLWANGVRNARIGMAGFFTSYPLYGPDLSNVVRYIGELKSDGEFTDYRSCEKWRRGVNDGTYDFLVLMPPFADRPDPPQLRWTQSSPGVELILRSKRARVFRIEGQLEPEGCDEDDTRR